MSETVNTLQERREALKDLVQKCVEAEPINFTLNMRLSSRLTRKLIRKSFSGTTQQALNLMSTQFSRVLEECQTEEVARKFLEIYVEVQMGFIPCLITVVGEVLDESIEDFDWERHKSHDQYDQLQFKTEEDVVKYFEQLCHQFGSFNWIMAPRKGKSEKTFSDYPYMNPKHFRDQPRTKYQSKNRTSE